MERINIIRLTNDEVLQAIKAYLRGQIRDDETVTGVRWEDGEGFQHDSFPPIDCIIDRG